MSFLTGFVTGRVLGSHQGITDEATLNRLSILGGVMGTSPMGLIMTTVLAQREAADVQPPAPTPVPTPTPKPPAIQIEVPDMIELTYNEAKRKLESLELTVAREDLYSLNTKNQVIRQKPEAGSIVSPGALVTLSVSLGSDLPGPTCPPSQESPSSQKTLVGAGSGGGSGKKES
jgi:hypothetical protein